MRLTLSSDLAGDATLKLYTTPGARTNPLRAPFRLMILVRLMGTVWEQIGTAHTGLRRQTTVVPNSWALGCSFTLQGSQH